MDPVKILRRAWQILWSYRALWVFGLILALAGAGASGRGSNNGVQYETNEQGNQQPLPQDMREAFQQFMQQIEQIREHGFPHAGITAEEIRTLIWIAAILFVLSLILSVILAVARYVSETAVIRMVDNYESTGSKMTLREGVRVGWSRTSWRLFLINLLINLPLILLMILFIILGVIVFQTVSQNNGHVSGPAIFGVAAIVFLIVFSTVIITIVLSMLRNFFWRVCALENVGVGESLRRGFQMVRENWKSVGIMWLVMIGLGIAWAIVSVIAIIVTLPVVAVTAVIGVLVAGIPALLAGGVTSLFLNGWLPWIVGGVFALPLFLVIAFSPWLLLGSWQTVFASTVWTLVYRELKALPALTNGSAPVEAATD